MLLNAWEKDCWLSYPHCRAIWLMGRREKASSLPQ